MIFKNLFNKIKIDTNRNENLVDNLTPTDLINFVEYLLEKNVKCEVVKNITGEHADHYFFNKYEKVETLDGKIFLKFYHDEVEKYNVIGTYNGNYLIDHKTKKYVLFDWVYEEEDLDEEIYNFLDIYDLIMKDLIQVVDLSELYLQYKEEKLFK